MAQIAQPARDRVSSRRIDRRRLKTRAALLDAGRMLLAARDIAGVSVDEIVAAADVAKGSFYNHFADKDVFARAIGAAVRRQVELAVAQSNAGVGDPAVAVARGLCVFVRFAIEHRDSAQVLWRLNSGSTMADAPVNRALRADLARGIEQGRFGTVDVEIGLLLVMGAVVIAMRHALEERAVSAPQVIAGGMASGMLRALGVSASAAARIAQAAVRYTFRDDAGARPAGRRAAPALRRPAVAAGRAGGHRFADQPDREHR